MIQAKLFSNVKGLKLMIEFMILFFVVFGTVALLETEPKRKKYMFGYADTMINLILEENPEPIMIKVLKNRYSGSHPGFTYSFDYGYFDFEKYEDMAHGFCPICEAEK
jgi:hypothetical protein